MEKRIYLDHASITPIDPRVTKIMEPYLKEKFHNPSSLYEEGRIARHDIDQARKKVAHVLQSKSDEIFFTSGGTEANNIAIQGVLKSFQLKNKKVHAITSSIEHSSVLEVFNNLEKSGIKVTYLDPNEDGIIEPRRVAAALRKETVFVSLMYANNEIGTINDIAKISKEVKRQRKEKKLPPVVLHTDASQGASYLNIRADYLGTDLITLDGSKIYGPRGSGVLYKKRGTTLIPLIFGGGQEEGIRSGTENTAAIVGFAEALSISEKEKKKEFKRVEVLRNLAFEKLRKNIPSLLLNGSMKARLPNNINVCFPGLDAEFLVIKLDLLGISCSSVTTCKNLMDDSSSYVIAKLDKKINSPEKRHCSKSSLRISLGRFTTRLELEKALKTLILYINTCLQSQNLPPKPKKPSGELTN